MPFMTGRTLMSKYYGMFDWREQYSTKPTSIPLDYTGLVLWLRSDLGITFNGSDVSAWADQSGNGRNVAQGTASKQPAYVTSGGQNNLPYLRFTTADSTFLRGTWTQASPTTIFLACVFDRTKAGGQDFTVIDGSAGNSRRIYNQAGAPTNVSQFVTGAAAPNTTTAANPSLFHLFEAGYHATAGSYFRCIDTGEQQSDFQMPAIAPNGIVIGIYGDQVSAPADCDVYEVLEFNRILTTSEKQGMRDYLRARYNTA